MSNSGPPKCKTCGKAEWRHICGGLPDAVKLKLALAGKNRKATAVDGVAWASDQSFRPVAVSVHDSATGEMVGCAALGDAIDGALRVGAEAVATATLPGGLVAPPKTDRREYLKLKARERRERQAAEKLGLSVAEYREKRGGEK